MTQDQWTAVDEYFERLYVPADPVLEAALQAADAAGLPPAQVAPNQGKLLNIFAQMIGARRILEIGTLGGYSTIWLARALPPDGSLVTLEYDPMHADVARSNFALAGLTNLIDIRVGKALDTLPQLAAENPDPFDLVFIDADKINNPAYLEWALKLTHRGSVIIGDNVVRNGMVLDSASDDPSVKGTRAFNELFTANPRISATAIQTVGSKGWDGFAIGVVVG
ncbi:MAG: O-methyltransferase [Anaerolineae bacterium]|nr:O-methyltransferase [Anaerolineae bacterium]